MSEDASTPRRPAAGSGALIVTAEFGAEDFAWLDGLRRRHFPPERNQVPAHLTLFHALALSAESEVRTRLAAAASAVAPRARIAGLMNLGRGVALRVVSEELDAMREELAGGLHGLLGAQDAGGWRPHVTIQDKVAPQQARALLADLQARFAPRPLIIAGLGLHRYQGGPWQGLARYSFRGRR